MRKGGVKRSGQGYANSWFWLSAGRGAGGHRETGMYPPSIEPSLFSELSVGNLRLSVSGPDDSVSIPLGVTCTGGAAGGVINSAAIVGGVGGSNCTEF